jgi:hypothetical protein
VRTRVDLLLVGCVVLGVLGLAEAIARASLPVEVTAPLAVLLVVAAPGFALQELLLPGRIGVAERAVATIVASLALAMATALVLSIASIGFGRTAVLASMGGLAVVLGAAALVRSPHRSGPALSPALIGAIVVGTVGIAAVGIYAASTTPPLRARDAYTLLGGHRVGSAVELDVRSAEVDTASYRLRVTVSGRPALNETFSLRPGDEHRTSVTAPSGSAVAGVLERSDAPGAAYRRIDLEGR